MAYRTVFPGCLDMYKWGLAHFSNCEFDAIEQTTDHIISQCPTHLAFQRMIDLTVLNVGTRCWLKSLAVSI